MAAADAEITRPRLCRSCSTTTASHSSARAAARDPVHNGDGAGAGCPVAVRANRKFDLQDGAVSAATLEPASCRCPISDGLCTLHLVACECLIPSLRAGRGRWARQFLRRHLALASLLISLHRNFKLEIILMMQAAALYAAVSAATLALAFSLLFEPQHQLLVGCDSFIPRSVKNYS